MIPRSKFLSAPPRFFAAMWRSFRYLLAGRPVIAPKFEQAERQAYCRGCEHNENGICSICVCFIDAKVLLAAEQCPDTPPRWLRLTRSHANPL